jgi:hypothetical protein
MELSINSGTYTTTGDVLGHGDKVTILGNTALDLFPLLLLLEQEGQHKKKEELEPLIEETMLNQNRQDNEGFMKGLIAIIERVGTDIMAKYLVAITKTGG